MKNALSFLLPAFNTRCTALVEELLHQANGIAGLSFEIIVADDGSTDKETIRHNSPIAQWPHCKLIERPVNVGRAAIRNFLARQARFPHLLFIDSDMSIVDADFVKRYVESPDDKPVVYGGYVLCPGNRSNLRYRYEQASAHLHTAKHRQQRPYHDFHTSNFLIEASIQAAHPFDERFRHYGYEDVLFGKTLKQAGIPILHIDNPVGFSEYEDNAAFLQKTEESLRTLCAFQSELKGYSRLLTIAEGIHLAPVRWFLRQLHRFVSPLERLILKSRHPNLSVFRAYQLGYLLLQLHKHKKQ